VHTRESLLKTLLFGTQPPLPFLIACSARNLLQYLHEGFVVKVWFIDGSIRECRNDSMYRDPRYGLIYF